MDEGHNFESLMQHAAGNDDTKNACVAVCPRRRIRERLMSLLSSLFGRLVPAQPEKVAEPVEYNGFIIRAAPFKSEGRYQTAGSSSARSTASTGSIGSSAPMRSLPTTMR
jgi:hypothetical protein